jgi:hypothetical protein
VIIGGNHETRIRVPDRVEFSGFRFPSPFSRFFPLKTKHQKATFAARVVAFGGSGQSF